MVKFLRTVLAVFICIVFTQSVMAADKLQVMASIYPMAEFCRGVGGDLVDVYQMVPNGVEPHDYEPSPKDLLKLGQMQVFVYNGGVEFWARPALQAIQEQQVNSVEAGQGLLTVAGKQDPHVWVSPRGAMQEVQKICETFCRVDGANAKQYKLNSERYLAELQKLDEQYSSLAKQYQRRTFVTAHAAFGHLAKDYGLQMVAVAGLSPEAEPTPQDLQKVLQLVKKYQVRYVFFETLTSPKLAELVAKETGALTAVLDPLEGVEDKDKVTYLDLQYRNLVALKREFAE